MNPVTPASVSRKRLMVFVFAILVVVIPVIILIAKGRLDIPSTSLLNKPSVKPKTTYKNPFEKETQYVNPFQTYKNPFAVNR